MSAPTILQHDAALVARHFETILARYTDAPARLLESIRYSLLAGGKPLRPTLLLQTHRACSAPTANWQLTTSNSALAAPASPELIPTYSLVHAALPAMEDDDRR